MAHACELVDKPMTENFSAELYAATAESLDKWEPRLKLERVKIDKTAEGKVSLTLQGTYLPKSKAIRLDGIIVT